MNDPHEEERQARFTDPIRGMLKVLDAVREDLVAAAASQHALESSDRVDRAMDLLFNALNLAKPLAFRRAENRRVAFLWADGGFNWIVCYRDGTFRGGRAEEQRECEQAVTLLLEAPPGEHD